MSKACFSGSSSEAFPSAALIPPSAAPEWLRVGMDLRDERDVGARIVRLDGRAHPRAAGPDNEHVVLRFHRRGRYRIAQVSRRVTIAACFTRTSCAGAMVSKRKGVLRIDRHRLGPRVYVLGTRVHEWHLGAALLLGLALGGLFDRVDDNFAHGRGDRRRALARGEGLARPLPGSARQRGLATRPACTRPPAQGRSARRSAAEGRGRHRGARRPREPRVGGHPEHRLAEPPAPVRRAVRDAQAQPRRGDPRLDAVARDLAVPLGAPPGRAAAGARAARSG